MSWIEIGLFAAVMVAAVSLGTIAGGKIGHSKAKREFDKEVQETALAKTNRILHDANRTHLPREDAGPPAKIYRGKPGRKPQHRKKS